MRYTKMLEILLEKAEKVRAQYNGAHLYASHIAAAVVVLCKEKYTGFCSSDHTYHPYRFEEERLRYLLAKEVKLSAFFTMCLSRNAKRGVQEEAFDMACCEAVARQRWAEVLSADVVFVCAMEKLHESYRSAVRSIESPDFVRSLLDDVDQNIYSYVEKSIEEVCEQLRKKAEEAVAIRDWKPAAKFAEPEDVAADFFGKIEKTVNGNQIILRFPGFFGTTDLKVSIYQVEGIYYIHDNGCAVKHLFKQINDEKKRERALKKVCHACRIHKKRVIGRFVKGYQFLTYLQDLIFIAHADLVYTRVEKALCVGDKGTVFKDVSQAEPLDEESLIKELKESVLFQYNENKGLYLWLHTRYSLSSETIAFLMETREKGMIQFSDYKKGEVEGEIWEAFYWSHENLSLYSKFITNITSRFGVAFDGKDLYLIDKEKNYVAALFKFFNTAVLLSEFGHEIALPKVRRQR